MSTTTKKYKWRIKAIKIESESGEILEITANKRKKKSCVFMDDLSVVGLDKIKETLSDARVEARVREHYAALKAKEKLEKKNAKR